MLNAFGGGGIFAPNGQASQKTAGLAAKLQSQSPEESPEASDLRDCFQSHQDGAPLIRGFVRSEARRPSSATPRSAATAALRQKFPDLNNRQIQSMMRQQFTHPLTDANVLHVNDKTQLSDFLSASVY